MACLQVNIYVLYRLVFTPEINLQLSICELYFQSAHISNCLNLVINDISRDYQLANFYRV